MKILKLVLLILVCILAAFLALNIVFFLVLLLLAIPVKKRPIEKQKQIYRWACVAFSAWACGLAGVKIYVTGKELLPITGRFVFVCNHRSLFDPLSALVGLRKYNISFISKPSNMDIPVLGSLAWAAGFLPIDRENDRNALTTILQAVKYVKSDLCSIGVYPEGTRCKEEGVLLPYHPGSFKLAQKAKVPLVIASSKNADQVFKNLFRRRTNIYLDILEVIPPEKLCDMGTVEIAEYAQKLTEEHLYGK